MAADATVGAFVSLERVQERADRGLDRTAGGDRGFAFGVHLAVIDAGVSEVNLEIRGAGKRALDQGLGERVLDVLLEGPAQRPRAVTAVGAGLLEEILRRL